MYIHYEPCTAGDLQPGDLYCLDPGEQASRGRAHRVTPPAGVAGFGAYSVRTDEPCKSRDAGAPLYRVTIYREGK